MGRKPCRSRSIHDCLGFESASMIALPEIAVRCFVRIMTRLALLGLLGCGASAHTEDGHDPAPQGRLLHEMFSDHAVLQRDRPIAVWGEASAGDRVTLSLGAASAETRADAGGHWRAALPAQAAGGPYTLTVHAQSGRSQSIADVLLGDVYLCSGQSNMELAVGRALDAADEIAAA